MWLWLKSDGTLTDEHGKALVPSAEAAKIIGCTNGRIRQITERLEGIRIGNNWYFQTDICKGYREETDGIGRPGGGVACV